MGSICWFDYSRRRPGLRIERGVMTDRVRPGRAPQKK